MLAKSKANEIIRKLIEVEKNYHFTSFQEPEVDQPSSVYYDFDVYANTPIQCLGISEIVINQVIDSVTA